MTMDEYEEVSNSHVRPYIFQFETAKGALLFYGSEHTMDPNDLQLEDIEKKYDLNQTELTELLNIICSSLMIFVIWMNQIGELRKNRR